MGKEITISYYAKPTSVNIEVPNFDRCKGVGFLITDLARRIKSPLSYKNIAYADDMGLSMKSFARANVSLLITLANGDKMAKETVQSHNGFISEKKAAEGMVEFFNEIYPKEYKDLHSKIATIVCDMDGVVFDRERGEEAIPFYDQLTSYIETCKGPFTDRPPITIATGAYFQSLKKTLRFIKIDKNHIAKEMFNVWPKMIYDEGGMAYDPVTEEHFDLTEEKYGLFSPEQRVARKMIEDIGIKIERVVPVLDKKLETLLGRKFEDVPCGSFWKKIGYNLDLPMDIRKAGVEKIMEAHKIIWKEIKDCLPLELIRVGGMVNSAKELE